MADGGTGPADASIKAAVVCVFGVFFLPDIAAGIRELWRLVRPGGQLADAAARVRAVNLARIETAGIRAVETNVVYSIARRPGLS